MKININNPWGDVVNTVKYSKPLDEWYTDHPRLEYNFFKLPSQYKFNIEEMRQNISTLLNSYETQSIDRDESGRKYNRYKGLGFLARKDSAFPLEDHFIRRDVKDGIVYLENLYLKENLPELYEDDFTEPTKIYNQYFQKVFSVFKSHITKASILELKRKGFLASHVDFPYYKGIRLHSTIFGGENAWYEVAGEKFQIPADGHWYFIDTGKFHSVWNEGPKDRLTLNVNLNITGNPLLLANSNLL